MGIYSHLLLVGSYEVTANMVRMLALLYILFDDLSVQGSNKAFPFEASFSKFHYLEIFFPSNLDYFYK